MVGYRKHHTTHEIGNYHTKSKLMGYLPIHGIEDNINNPCYDMYCNIMKSEVEERRWWSNKVCKYQLISMIFKTGMAVPRHRSGEQVQVVDHTARVAAGVVRLH